MTVSKFCLICFTKLKLVKRQETHEKHKFKQRVNILLKYLMGSSSTVGNLMKQDILNLFSDDMIGFCDGCELQVDNMIKLHLELEKVKMLILEGVNAIGNKIVGNRNVWRSENGVGSRDNDLSIEDVNCIGVLEEFGEIVSKITNTLPNPRVTLKRLVKTEAQAISDISYHDATSPMENEPDCDWSPPRTNSEEEQEVISETEHSLNSPRRKEANEVKISPDQDDPSSSDDDVEKKPNITQIAELTTSPRKSKRIGINQSPTRTVKSFADLTSSILTDARPALPPAKRKKLKSPTKSRKEAVTSSPFKEKANKLKLRFLKPSKKAIPQPPKQETPDKLPTVRKRRVQIRKRFKLPQKVWDHATNKFKVLGKGHHCQSCPFKAIDIPKFQEHLVSHETDEKNFICYQCDKSFSTPQYFKFHQDLHSGIYQVHCDICQEYVNSFEIAAHLKGHPEVEHVFSCSKCIKCYSSITKFISHINDHVGVLICPLCSIPFESKSKKELFDHLKSDHNVVIEEFKCDIEGCNKTFVNEEKLKSHKRRHTDKFECKVCQKRFPFQCHLDRHIKCTHENEKLFKCDQCPEEFKYRYTLETHLRKKHGADKEKCQICSKEFFSIGAFKSHMTEEHNWKGRFCPICNKRFGSGTKRDRHIELEHSDGNPYICEECGKVFDRKMNLQRHKNNIHQSDKTYQCTHCQRSFRNKVYLSRHLKTHNDAANSQ